VPEYALPDLDELKARHSALLVAYLRAIDAAANTERLAGGSVLTRPKAIQLLVGSHVRARSLEIAKRYTQVRQARDASDDEEMVAWLDDHSDACTRFADSLDSLRLPGLFALLPFALTIGAAVAKIPVDVLELILFGLGGYILVGPFFVIANFRHKRELLLPGARDQDKGRAAEDGAGVNVYAAEAALFGLFARPRPTELSVDRATSHVLHVAVLALVAAAVAALAGIGAVYAVLGVGALLWFSEGPLRALATWQYRRRLWR
jgi:hypothetical protein